MGTGYTRNDTSNNIADGNVINASDLDGEFDAVQAAFNGTTGHSHDGTTGEGPQIDTAGIANDAVTLGTKTSGNYVAAGAVSGVGLSGSASAEGATFTVTSNATSANTASTIVARDASGNFSAGTITATLSGNATTATTATTANSVAADSVALGTDTTGNYVAAGAVSGVGLSGSASAEGATFTVTSNATSANTANTIVSRDASGNFTAGDVTVGNLITSGNVDGRDVSADGSKLDGIASSADNYSSWTISDGSNSEAIGSGNTLTIAGGGDTTTSYSAASNTLTVTTNAPEAFPSGTSMLFQQTAAPTGWTKQTTHNDKALRIVTGTVGTGGSVGFASAMGTPSVSGSVSITGAPAIGNLAGNTTINGNPSVSGNISSHTLSVNQIPSHSHGGVFNPGEGFNNANAYGAGNGNAKNTDNTGGNLGHNHSHNFSGSVGTLAGNATINGAPGIGTLAGSLSSSTATINVNYVDFIIANKD